MRKYALLLAFLAPLLAAPASGDSPHAGNAFFEVLVEDAPGQDGIGALAVRTGPDHPAGGGQQVLFAGNHGDDAASSYLSVRSYTTGTDYVQTTRGAGSGNLVTSLDSLAFVEPIGSAGFRTTYTLPGAASTPDTLSIVTEIEATGTSIADAAVELRTRITNDGSVPTALGIRYLLDFANGGDDGPAWREAGGLPQNTEATRGVKPGIVTVSPTSIEAAPVTIAVGTSNPSAVIFGSWTHAFPFAFDYTPAGRDVAGPCGLNDSALLTYAGRDQASAILLAPGESATVSVTLSMGDSTYFESGGSEVCASPIPTEAPSPGPPTPVPEPIELPRTGARFRQP